ncbi:MAG: 2-polyprenyl-3-methyl-6-methoxy-1,4-benzoquinone monooxygenase [Gammaproteobacteria bacterium]|nr:2-polyprenyl-3-methyl-6-methoxy-1,4-benzoquinone monooxygenase [Gammaproteobacteria bacterium]
MGDAWIIRFDKSLRKLIHCLSESARQKHSAHLMRVNHAGEVCAQALYRGHAATASPHCKQKFLKAAEEENYHLLWCQERLQQLEAKPSRLNRVWYAGAFLVGAGAGLLGNRFALGFVAETERQVVRHLENHLNLLPSSDEKSRILLEHMKQDEARHATHALKDGGILLPKPVRWCMARMAKIMTTVAYWI